MDKFSKTVIAGVVVVIVAAWLSWVSVCSVSVDKRVTVLESVIIYIQNDMKEIKDILKEVRDDQKRRQGMEQRGK